MTWKKEPMAERLRWCWHHQKYHLGILHCHDCGGDLAQGLYYRCDACKAERAAAREAKKQARLENTLAAKEQRKLAAWKELAKP